jgi:hypothetical protein
LLRKESDENTLNQPRRPPAPRRSEAWQRRKMPPTHVNDLTGPALDADVSVLSESGTLHADDPNGVMRFGVVDEDGREGKKGERELRKQPILLFHLCWVRATHG